jgi:hypothetical protein
MNSRFKAAAPEDNWARVRAARFRPERGKEARKEPDDFRFPIANCRLKRQVSFQLQLEIGNRQLAMASEVRYVRG